MAYRADGKIEIKDNQTNRTFWIGQDELSAYGIPQADYDARKLQYEQQVAAYGQTGKVATPEEASIIAGAQAQGITAPKTKEQEQEGKNIATINNLEDLFFGKEGEESLAFGTAGLGGRLPGTLKNIERAVSPGEVGSATERLNTYVRTLESIRPQLAKMAGDAGNIALAEQIQAGKGLPQSTDTPSEAIEIMQATRAKFGLEPSERLERLKEEIKGEDKGLSKKPPTLGGVAVGAVKGVGEFLFGETLNLVKDIRQSVGMDKKLGAIDNARKRAEQLTKEGKIEEAQELLDNTILEAQELVEGFSESVDKPTWQRAAGVGLEAGTVLGLPSLAKGITGGGKVVAKKLFSPKVALSSLDEGLTIAKQGSAMRQAAIETAQKAGKSVSGDSIFEGVVKWGDDAVRAFPDEARNTSKLIKSLKTQLKGKTLTPKEVGRIWDLADSGFTQAGKTGSGLQQSFFRIYRDSIRSALDAVAPGFDEGTSLIRKGLSMEKLLKPVREGLQRKEIRLGLEPPVLGTVKKYGGRIAGGAATGLGLAAIAKILGIRLSGAAESPE